MSEELKATQATWELSYKILSQGRFRYRAFVLRGVVLHEIITQAIMLRCVWIGLKRRLQSDPLPSKQGGLAPLTQLIHVVVGLVIGISGHVTGSCHAMFSYTHI